MADLLNKITEANAQRAARVAADINIINENFNRINLDTIDYNADIENLQLAINANDTVRITAIMGDIDFLISNLTTAVNEIIRASVDIVSATQTFLITVIEALITDP